MSLLQKVKHRDTLPSTGEHYIQPLLETNNCMHYAVTIFALFKDKIMNTQ